MAWPSLTSLTTRVLAGAIVISAMVWVVLDRVQNQTLYEIYYKQLSNRLQTEAQQDRLRFDEGVRAHFHGVDLTARLASMRRSYSRLRDATPDWSTPGATVPIPTPERQPDWLPDRSLLREHIVPNFLIVLDPEFRIRRIFAPFGETFPALERHSLPLMVIKSQKQSLLSEINGAPYLIASRHVEDDQGHRLGTLLSIAKIDTRFLRWTQKGFLDRDSIVILTTGKEQTVIASSDTARLPLGADLTTLTDTYVTTGMAFFDYGSSEIQTNFLTLMPKSVMENRMAPVLSLGRNQRTLMATLFTGLLLAFLLYIAHRIRRLKANVVDFSRQIHDTTLPASLDEGDELTSTARHFDQLAREIVASRSALDAETHAKMEAVRQRTEAKTELARLALLRDLADALGVGVLDIGGEAPRPRTPTMERFFNECGGAETFSGLVPNQDKVIESGPCKGRIFQVSHPPGLGEGLLLVEDVTERRHAENKIRALALFPAQNPNPVLRVAVDGTIQMANKASARLLDTWDTGEGEPVPEKLHEIMLQALKKDHPVEQETVVGDQHLLLTFAPAPDGDYVNIYGLDITERTNAEQALKTYRDELEQRVEDRTRSLSHEIERRKLIESALIEAKEQAEMASRAKSDFLAAMSHELRTPLNAIIGFSDMMASEALGPVGNETYKEYLSDIHDSGQHLLNLINDILDVSKIEAGKMTIAGAMVDINTVLEKARRLSSGRAAISNVLLKVDSRADLGLAWADERRAVQVLINLLSNAVKFSEPGASVTMRATGTDDRVEITVTDTGIGMTAQECETVMKPFEQADQRLQRRYEGTGLGLYLSKSFIELMGGRLTLNSVKGEGTTATVVLLRQPPQLQTEALPDTERDSEHDTVAAL